MAERKFGALQRLKAVELPDSVDLPPSHLITQDEIDSILTELGLSTTSEGTESSAKVFDTEFPSSFLQKF